VTTLGTHAGLPPREFRLTEALSRAPARLGDSFHLREPPITLWIVRVCRANVDRDHDGMIRVVHFMIILCPACVHYWSLR